MRVLRSPAAVRRAGRGARVIDAPDGVLTPGMVNAHAHLELGGLAGQVSGDEGFSAWVGTLLSARGSRSGRQLERDAARGAARLLATGASTVGDIDTTGAGLRAALSGVGPSRIIFREVLDAWDHERTEGALAAVARGLPRRRGLKEGISPHAPFTTSLALLRGAQRIARRRSLPVSIHWSESEDEVLWLESGEGPLRDVLPASPRTRGLDLIEEAGLLGPQTSLIHGNLPQRGEPARLARAGSSLVHCPGTHAFFSREPFPLERYRRAGVNLALGTDSLASNTDLDLRAELAILRESAPGLSPVAAWTMATTGGARALGLEGQCGELYPGAQADVFCFAVSASSRLAALEELTGGRPQIRAGWLAGRPLPALALTESTPGR